MKKLLITAALLAVSVGAFANGEPSNIAPSQICITFHLQNVQSKYDEANFNLQLSYPGSGGPFTSTITDSHTICVDPWHPGLGPHAFFDVWAENDHEGYPAFIQCSEGIHADVSNYSHRLNVAYVYDYNVTDDNSKGRIGWQDSCRFTKTQPVDASKNWSYRH